MNVFIGQKHIAYSQYQNRVCQLFVAHNTKAISEAPVDIRAFILFIQLQLSISFSLSMSAFLAQFYLYFLYFAGHR